jgi:hypothetical protein
MLKVPKYPPLVNHIIEATLSSLVFLCLIPLSFHSVWEEENEWNGIEKKKEKNIFSFLLFGSLSMRAWK